MTPGELRVMRWRCHDFITLDHQDEDGKPFRGAYCTRCSMFVPGVYWGTVDHCRPMPRGGDGIVGE